MKKLQIARTFVMLLAPVLPSLPALAQSVQNSATGVYLQYGSAEKTLPAEFLRVYSPSAEVRGHAPGQEVLQTGKQDVTISDLEPAGHYALKISFSDRHNSGLYDWDYLYQLAHEYDTMWSDYLRRLAEAGASRQA